jgi:hypothetical protein
LASPRSFDAMLENMATSKHADKQNATAASPYSRRHMLSSLCLIETAVGTMAH